MRSSGDTGCLLKGSVGSFNRCAVMVVRSTVTRLVLERITGSLIKVYNKGSRNSSGIFSGSSFDVIFILDIFRARSSSLLISASDRIACFFKVTVALCIVSGVNDLVSDTRAEIKSELSPRAMKRLTMRERRDRGFQ